MQSECRTRPAGFVMWRQSQEVALLCEGFLSAPQDWTKYIKRTAGIVSAEGRGIFFISLSSHAAFERRLYGVKWPDGGRGEETQAVDSHFSAPHLPAGLSETQINTATSAIYKLRSRHNFTHYPTKVRHASVACIQTTIISAAIFQNPHLLLSLCSAPQEGKPWMLIFLEGMRHRRRKRYLLL